MKQWLSAIGAAKIDLAPTYNCISIKCKNYILVTHRVTHWIE
jgi:hypothetical protein